MLFLQSHTDDPCFNLALEEYLLKNISEDAIFIYSNKPCVIVGKHQNAMAETNYRFLCEEEIPLIRRISGGGTVYHDPGNINFSFIKNGEVGNLVNFRSFIEPIADFLITKGLSPEIGSRNDILINHFKVSGNAEHIYKTRTLHHGTLLYSSQLNNLRNALKVIPGKYMDKAVKSVRSHVTNLADYMPFPESVEQFRESLCAYLTERFECRSLNLSPSAHTILQDYMDQKYKQWDWNFGYSPNYSFYNKGTIGSFQVEIKLTAERGLIRETEITGDFDPESTRILSAELCQKPHRQEILATFLRQSNFTFLTEIEKEELIWLFF